MTVRELEPIAESIKTFLEKVDPLTLDTTAEYRLSRNAKFCDQALKQSVESQGKLFTRFVKKDDNGQPVQVKVKRLDPDTGEQVEVPIPNRFELDNPEDYNAEIEKVKDEAVDEIKWTRVPLSLLANTKGPKGPLFYNGDLFIVDDAEETEIVKFLTLHANSQHPDSDLKGYIESFVNGCKDLLKKMGLSE